MSISSESWELWLKLIFVSNQSCNYRGTQLTDAPQALACVIVAIVGIALFVNLWMNCKHRKQRRDHLLGREQRHLVSHPGAVNGQEMGIDAQTQLKSSPGDGAWQSRFYSNFGLAYTTSDNSLESQNSKRTVLLPARPDVAGDAQNLALSSTAPIPIAINSQQGIETPRRPFHEATSSKTRLSQYQEMPAEEAAYIPASPSILRPYLRQEDDLRSYQTYNPYRTINSTVQAKPGGSPTTQRSSYQTTRQHQSLSPNTRYSHIQPISQDSYHTAAQTPGIQELGERSVAADDSASQITTLPALPPLRFDQNRRPYYLPVLDVAAAANAVPDHRPQSLQAGFRGTVSPTYSQSNYSQNPHSRQTSVVLVSPQHEDPLLGDVELAPMPLSPVRNRGQGQVQVYGQGHGQGQGQGFRMELRPARMSEPGYGRLAYMGSGWGGPNEGYRMESNTAYMHHGALGPRSVASTAQSQSQSLGHGQKAARKLQKRQRSAAHARTASWLTQ